MMSDAEKLANQMAGFRPETAHLNVPGFPNWDWLPFVRRGWRWDLNNRGRLVTYMGLDGDATPIIMRPGDSYNFPILEVNQPQWLIMVILVTTSPFVKFTATIDDFLYSVSHADLNALFGPNFASKWLSQATRPKLITPLGVPFYTLVLDPTEPISVTKQLTLTASVPTGMPVTAVEVLDMSVGRVVVDDYSVFLDEVRKTAVEIAAGQNVKQWSDAISPDKKLIADIGQSGRRKL